MKILFSSLASHGHLYPLLPLAIAAKSAGHEVVFATDSAMHGSVRSAGIEPLQAGMGMRDAFAEVAQRTLEGGAVAMREQIPPEKMQEMIAAVFAEAMPRRFATDLAPVIEDVRPDLVVQEAGNSGAAFAAMAAGIPVVCHAFGRANPHGSRDTAIAARLAKTASEFGVTLADPDNFGLGNPYLDIYPPSLQEPEFLATANRVELRPVPYAEPGELPAVVREDGKPLVYLTLGTAFGSVGVLKQAIDGLAALDARVLVAAGPTVDAAALGGVPDNVFVEPWVPQADLLRYTSLVVHHGGAGTTLGTAAAGVPQLFLPQGADQFTNADAVTGGGAGVQLVPEEFSVDAVTERARHLLSDTGVQDAARRVAAEIAAMPSPEDIAARLGEFV
ncbi:glycosyltransferase [Amycolatopsis sp. CA-230715]|uniref:glycosyltransferase n=1 Tax=Amycolatopsis sp. CA-230715 TaxID=2745196 RepID=UPI001C01FA73|nr:glycosyltransferase [Amycolatopsis sp. CA-230715]